jgi:hypothetical protein
MRGIARELKDCGLPAIKEYVQIVAPVGSKRKIYLNDVVLSGGLS